MALHVGISGWTYAGWRGVFYPAGLPHRRELEYVARRFDTVEINGTFYSMQRPESFRAWREQTPPGFTFAVKASRFITHMLKLRRCRTALANFFASGVLALQDKLGPLLWQLPAQVRFHADVIEQFLELLPRTTAEAARLAREHDARVEKRSFLGPVRNRRLRHAFEVRHESFLCRGFLGLLRRHRAALVVADTAGIWPYAEDVTADFVYVRLHGTGQIYAGGYGPEAIEWWARRIEAWRDGGEPAGAIRAGGPAPRRTSRDVYVYFDNDAKVRAPFDAQALAARLGARSGSGR
ncbi:MAG: DUF72 domain-containing protein [Acidobacteria bacterium]|nr:DUF72 domain-containing protein [Acidobacteriota bacterium]